MDTVIPFCLFSVYIDQYAFDIINRNRSKLRLLIGFGSTVGDIHFKTMVFCGNLLTMYTKVHIKCELVCIIRTMIYTAMINMENITLLPLNHSSYQFPKSGSNQHE